MIGYSKRIEKIIRESAFDEKKKKPGLTFNPRLALTVLQTTGAWALVKFVDLVTGRLFEVGADTRLGAY